MKFKKSIRIFLVTSVLAALFSGSVFAVWHTALGYESINYDERISENIKQRIKVSGSLSILQVMSMVYCRYEPAKKVKSFFEKNPNIQKKGYVLCEKFLDLVCFLKLERICINTIPEYADVQEFINCNLHKNLWIVTTYTNGENYSRTPISEDAQLVLLLVFGYNEESNMKVKVFDPIKQKIDDILLEDILKAAKDFDGVRLKVS